MQVTKNISNKFGTYYTTDQFCPQCDSQGEITLLDYSLAGEVLYCRVCGYISDWRPLVDEDVCVDFPHPKHTLPEPIPIPKPTAPKARFYSDTKTLAENALAAIRFPIAYTDWLKIGFALASEFGARHAAELMYRYSPPTNQDETVEDYEKKFGKANGRVKIGTLFVIAKQHGWNFPTQRQSHTPAKPKAVKLVFTETLQGVRARCPNCNHFTLELTEFLNTPFVKCGNCGFESPASIFEIRHISAKEAAEINAKLQSGLDAIKKMYDCRSITHTDAIKYALHCLNKVGRGKGFCAQILLGKI